MARTRSTPAPDFENTIPSIEAQDSSGAHMTGLAGDTIEVTTIVPGTPRAGTPRSGTVRVQSAAPTARRRRRGESVDLNSGLDNDDASAQLQRMQREVIEAELMIKRQKISFDQAEHTQRLRQSELESNARIEALRRPVEVLAPSTLATDTDPTEHLRELISSPAVQKLCALFPTVDQRQLARVYKWPNYEYDTSEIYKLKATTAFDAVDDTFESKMTASGKVEYSRKKGSEKDYKTPAIWSAAFLQ
jgi:hypothetical protein